MTSNATYSRTITVDLPDFASKSLAFTLLTSVAIDAANNEVFPRKEYSLTLDGSGTGSIALPCPDNSGSAAWAWRVELPDGRDVTTTMAYAGTSLDLSDWLTAEATTETASTIQALVSGKADKVSGATADNLAGLDANGNLQDSGYGVIDEDSMATDSATDVPTQQSVKAYVDAQIGTVDDVTELTTTTGASTNMLRVAAAGGLEYRTTAQVLSDIGAEASGAAATVQGNLDSHTGNTSNPHSVTAAQVDAPTTGDFTGHTGNTSNPHSVTAAQVGAYTTAQTDSAIDTDIGTHAALTSSVHGISVFGATLVDDADAATARGTLGLGSAAVEDASAFDAAGSAASAQAASQPLDSDLTAIAGLDSSDSNFIVGSATGWVAESGATARTSLGLGTMATEATTSYLAATGATTGATSQAQTFTNGVATAIIKAISDGATGLQLQSSSGSTAVTVDTTSRNVSITNHLGIDATASNDIACYIDAAVVNPGSALVAGVAGEMLITSIGSASILAGLSFAPQTLASTGTLGSLVGVRTRVRANHTGGTVTTAYGFQMEAPDNSGAGAVTTMYGLYLDDVAIASTNYAIYTGAGQVRFGDRLTVVQDSATAAVPVLTLQQDDDSEDMIEFTGTVGTGNAIEAVGAKTLTVTHFVKCTITGVGERYIALGTIA